MGQGAPNMGQGAPNRAGRTCRISLGVVGAERATSRICTSDSRDDAPSSPQNAMKPTLEQEARRVMAREGNVRAM
eukprot:6950690-Prymnesium_polylepis.1